MPETKQKKEHSAIVKQIPGFKFPLPTQAEISRGGGEIRREETTLLYINHTGASILLENPVTIGTQVKLFISLPPKLNPEGRLRLILKGRVIFVETAGGESSRQRISLKLESKYVVEQA